MGARCTQPQTLRSLTIFTGPSLVLLPKGSMGEGSLSNATPGDDGLPAVKSQLSKPANQITPPASLTNLPTVGQQLMLDEIESLLEQLPARHHQSFEDSFFQRGQRRMLGPGHFNRYRQLRHVASPHSASLRNATCHLSSKTGFGGYCRGGDATSRRDSPGQVWA